MQYLCLCSIGLQDDAGGLPCSRCGQVDWFQGDSQRWGRRSGRAVGEAPIGLLLGSDLSGW